MPALFYWTPPQAAEERERNAHKAKLASAKLNFLRNPRHRTNGMCQGNGEEVFSPNPKVIVFKEYHIGGTFKMVLQFKNISKISRRLRLLPPVSGTRSDWR